MDAGVPDSWIRALKLKALISLFSFVIELLWNKIAEMRELREDPQIELYIYLS